MISFNRPYLSGKEIEYIATALRGGAHQGEGIFLRRVREHLESKYPESRVIPVTSGTHALEIATALAGLAPGDEVILPSFAFTSTANAVLARGARPVFAEILPENLCLDPADVRRKLSTRTKAILPVHYAGQMSAPEELVEIAREYNLIIIEDAAQAYGALYQGEMLGSRGDYACLSFHQTKNVGCGEGGALILNGAAKEKYIEACVLRDKGTNRVAFLAGEVEKYEWVSYGSNYNLSEIQAAHLTAQLEAEVEIAARRREIFDHYHEWARGLDDKKIISYAGTSDGFTNNYHIFYLIMAEERLREPLLEAMKEKGVEATSHYEPLHASPQGRKLGYAPDDLPLTRRLAKSLVRLPLYPDLSIAEKEKVMAVFTAVLEEI